MPDAVYHRVLIELAAYFLRLGAARRFLDGVSAAAVAVIAVVVVALARHAIVDLRTMAAALAGLVLVAVLRVNAAWAILAAAALGALL